jgi:hypothetical protein
VRVALYLMLAGLSVSQPSAAQPWDAPQNLDADWVDGQVFLAWDAVDGAVAYHVYQDGLYIATSEAPDFTVPSSQSSSASMYWVTALLPEGESIPSNPASPYCWGFTEGIPPIYVNPEACLGP